VVEEAGRILADNAISACRSCGATSCGMDHESHLFSILMDLFGARRPGASRMPVLMSKGGLAKISAAGGGCRRQFVSFGTHPDSETITFKVQGVTRTSCWQP